MSSREGISVAVAISWHQAVVGGVRGDRPAPRTSGDVRVCGCTTRLGVRGNALSQVLQPAKALHRSRTQACATAAGHSLSSRTISAWLDVDGAPLRRRQRQAHFQKCSRRHEVAQDVAEKVVVGAPRRRVTSMMPAASMTGSQSTSQYLPGPQVLAAVSSSMEGQPGLHGGVESGLPAGRDRNAQSTLVWVSIEAQRRSCREVSLDVEIVRLSTQREVRVGVGHACGQAVEGRAGGSSDAAHIGGSCVSAEERGVNRSRERRGTGGRFPQPAENEQHPPTIRSVGAVMSGGSA